MPNHRRRRIGCWLFLAVLIIALLVGGREFQRRIREHPEQFPWTQLDLQDPIGTFTGAKLAALGDEPDRCVDLLRSAGLAETRFIQPFPNERRCRFADGVRLQPEDSRSIRYAPSGLVTSCPVAAALALWEREVAQPAARRHFGRRLVRISHAGSYSCRRLYGRPEGQFSEHATADAIDIVGFELSDGRNLSVLRDWNGDEAERRFLREVRDGACAVFSTVLSPDHNRAHADHFHFDQASRGSFGWRLCR